MKKILLFLGITLILFQNGIKAEVAMDSSIIVKVETLENNECVTDDARYKIYRLDINLVSEVLLVDSEDYQEHINSLKFNEKNAELYKWGIELDEFFDKDISYYKIPQFIQYNNKQFPVTKIGPNAFEGCKNLTSITIPKGVKIIRDQAFENCKSLSAVSIPRTVERIDCGAFEGCDGLKTITIPIKFKNELKDIFYKVDLSKVKITYI